jgi:hypothetical protein
MPPVIWTNHNAGNGSRDSLCYSHISLLGLKRKFSFSYFRENFAKKSYENIRK